MARQMQTLIAKAPGARGMKAGGLMLMPTRQGCNNESNKYNLRANPHAQPLHKPSYPHKGALH